MLEDDVHFRKKRKGQQDSEVKIFSRAVMTRFSEKVEWVTYTYLYMLLIIGIML